MEIHFLPQQALPFAMPRPISQAQPKALPNRGESHRVSLSEPHNPRYRAGHLPVARGLRVEMFPAVGRERVEAGATIIGRQTPLPFDPAIEFQPLESGVERSFFYLQEIVRQ